MKYVTKKYIMELGGFGEYHLFAPGPIRIPDVIKRTFLVDPPYFTSEGFSDLIREIQPKLQAVFNTRNLVLIGTGSGTLGMEMAVSNFFSEGDNVIVVDSGKYGTNWALMCESYGLKVNWVSVKPGEPVSIADIDDQFTNDTVGIFVTHVETTTGVLHPIKEISDKYKKKCLILVDAVSSLLTEPLCADDYDVVISASQKAISIPPGLFFMSVSHDASTHYAAESSLPKFYFDVTNELLRLEKGITTFTPASNLYLALNVALDEILKYGVENIIRGTGHIAAETRKHLSRDFDLFSNEPCNAVTACICTNSNLLIKRLYDEGIVVGSGVRELNDKIFRVMHFGWDLSEKELNSVIKSILILHDPYP